MDGAGSLRRSTAWVAARDAVCRVLRWVAPFSPQPRRARRVFRIKEVAAALAELRAGGMTRIDAGGISLALCQPPARRSGCRRRGGATPWDRRLRRRSACLRAGLGYFGDDACRTAMAVPRSLACGTRSGLAAGVIVVGARDRRANPSPLRSRRGPLGRDRDSWGRRATVTESPSRTRCTVAHHGA